MTTIGEIVARWPEEAAQYAKLTEEQRTKFDAWMVELEIAHQKACRPYGEKKPLAEITGPMCWFSFFEDGWEPADALDEDLSNA